ncbi:hypothetical protein N0V93_008909 [Gnomoniopsis smithogilvyi]|uniref:pectin lyase n=1 Tax=Gnomoniopsis smithogilvyi TaxID=1191159 RepID=A0A9W8YJU1_9PEZI|nr:hypothetical protein N0V93_008909 [Gnomoniopsis smithogilvyi]
MKYLSVATMAMAGLGHLAEAAISSVVSGTPMGFAAAVTGGGDADPVYPTTIDELKTYLTSADPQVIVISGTFNFQGSEGSTTEQACNQYSCTPDEGGQALLNTLDGCGDYALYDVLLDTAAMEGINVESNKTLVGKDNAVLYGKGLRFAGVSNIIVQNIAITNLNPRYVWGGDALVFADSSLIWIDHVATSYTGRQHYAFGQNPDASITVSNSYLNGYTSNSATCDNHTYWAMELVGTDDSITWYKNHIYYTSGRTPALSGSTLFHAVNNIWEDNSGHLLEGTDNGRGLYEGNYFINTPLIADSGFVGSLFSSSAADVASCSSALGRDCVQNAYNNTGSFDFADTDFLSDFSAFTVVTPDSADSVVSSLLSGAGNTL